MNTKEALKRVDALENEARELRKIIAKDGPLVDRIKTWEDVCNEAGEDPLKILPYQNPTNDFQVGLNAFAKVALITNVFRQGWIPDWKNSSEYKYYPWFEYKKVGSGFGFSCTGYGDWITRADVGSRLCLPDSDTAIYVGKQFEKEYNEFLTLNK